MQIPGASHAPSRRTALVAVFVVVLVLLANLPAIETSRMLVGTLLVLAFGLWYLVGRGTERSVPSAALLALGLLLGWMLVAGAASTERSASLSAWFPQAAYILLFLAGLGVSRSRLGSIRTVVVIGAAVTAVAAIAQGVLQERLRLPGFIGNSEPFGAFLAVVLPLAVAEVAARSGRARWYALAAAGAITLALAASFSYTAWVGLGIGGVVVLQRSGRSFGRVLRTGALGLAAVLLLLVGIRFATSRDVTSALRVWTTIAPESFRASFDQRLGFQEAALRMVADRPWMGTGPGTFQTAFPRYAVSVQEQPRYVHNRYLELAVESGLPALALLAVFLYAALRRPAVQLRGEQDPTVVALGAAVATGLVAAALDFGMQFPIVAALWWLLLGTLVGAFTIPSPGPSRSARTRTVAAVLASLAILVLLRGIVLAAAGTFANRAELESRDGDGEAARGWWERTLQLDPQPETFESIGWSWFGDRSDPGNLDRAWQVTEREGWWGAGSYFRAHLRARIAYAQDDLPRAVTEYERALDLDPWFHLNFHYDYAVALRDSGRVPEATVVLHRVLDRYTRIGFSSSPTYRSGLTHCAVLLGDLYHADGRDAAAIRAYRHALVYDPGFAPAVGALTTLGAEPTPAVLY